MTAFKTGKRTQDGREVLFMPTAPNITTGFVIEVDPDQFTETDERVEEALTRILSAGFAEEERTVEFYETSPSEANDGDPPADDEVTAGAGDAGTADAETR
jgi:uncharacterized membrane protein